MMAQSCAEGTWEISNYGRFMKIIKQHLCLVKEKTPTELTKLKRIKVLNKWDRPTIIIYYFVYIYEDH